jgi:CcmD family protein
VSDLSWFFVAVMIVWVAIGAYLVTLSTRQRKLEARLAELRGGDESR